FARQQSVETQVPPEIVMQELLAAIQFPLAQDVERLAIQHENSTGTIAVGSSERADVNALGTAMNRVRARVIRPAENFLRLDYFDHFRVPRIGLGIQNMNPRRAQPRHNQVTALDMRMGSVGTEGRTAGVPA